MRLLLLCLLISACAVSRPRPEPDRPQPTPVARESARPEPSGTPTPLAVAMLPLAAYGEAELSQWLDGQLQQRLMGRVPGQLIVMRTGQSGFLKGPASEAPLVIGGRVTGIRRLSGEARVSLELRLQRSRDAGVLWSRTVTAKVAGQGEGAVRQAAEKALADLLRDLLPLRPEWLQDASASPRL